MKIKIEFLGVLRRELGKESIEVDLGNELGESPSLRDFLKYLVSIYPKLDIAIGRDGLLTTSYMLFINGIDYMVLGGYNYKLRDLDKLTFIPIAHGGR